MQHPRALTRTEAKIRLLPRSTTRDRCSSNVTAPQSRASPVKRQNIPGSSGRRTRQEFCEVLITAGHRPAAGTIHPAPPESARGRASGPRRVCLAPGDAGALP